MLEGPLTCAITLIRIEKVNRVFGGTIGPSTGERMSRACFATVFLLHMIHRNSTFNIVNRLLKEYLLVRIGPSTPFIGAP